MAFSYNSDLDGYEVEWHCGFDLYFPNEHLSIHVRIGHLYTFFGEMSTRPLLVFLLDCSGGFAVEV